MTTMTTETTDLDLGQQTLEDTSRHQQTLNTMTTMTTMTTEKAIQIQVSRHQQTLEDTSRH